MATAVELEQEGRAFEKAGKPDLALKSYKEAVRLYTASAERLKTSISRLAAGPTAAKGKAEAGGKWDTSIKSGKPLMVNTPGGPSALKKWSGWKPDYDPREEARSKDPK